MQGVGEISEVEIRFLVAQDASEWRRLRLEALEGDPVAFSASAEDHQLLSDQEIGSRIADTGDSFMAGAFRGGRLLGMAGFYREKGVKSRHKGRVWGVYVSPPERSRGLARQILDKLMVRARGIEGVEQVLLSVTATQDAARELYRSLGFEVFGLEPRALKIGGRYVDEEYMFMLIKSRRG